MPTVTINGNTYDVTALPVEAQQQIINIQFVDAELARLAQQQAVLQTARSVYANVLLNAVQADAPAAAPAAEKKPSRSRSKKA